MRIPLALALLLALAVPACGRGEGKPGPTVPVPGREGALKTAAAARAERRAYDGAPPVIPHRNFSMTCVSCHTERGMSVPEVGFAPPMPHGDTPGLSEYSRCQQCHAFRATEEVFVETAFEGLRQDLRRGPRMHPLAPPVLPHPVRMRENCFACHDGPAAREEIRTPHPERTRCLQCHMPVKTTAEFERQP